MSERAFYKLSAMKDRVGGHSAGVVSKLLPAPLLLPKPAPVTCLDICASLSFGPAPLSGVALPPLPQRFQYET